MCYVTVDLLFLQKNIFKPVVVKFIQIFFAPSLPLPTFLCMCSYHNKGTFNLQD